MATAEITVLPIGTDTPSISEFVVQAEKILTYYPEVNNKLTAMGTEIETDDIATMFDILKEMHLASFNNKAQRIYTVIKIDDRRDKKSTLESKVQSVAEKVEA